MTKCKCKCKEHRAAKLSKQAGKETPAWSSERKSKQAVVKYVCILTHTHIHTHTHTHKYTHIHTHTHTSEPYWDHSSNFLPLCWHTHTHTQECFHSICHWKHSARPY